MCTYVWNSKANVVLEDIRPVEGVCFSFIRGHRCLLYELCDFLLEVSSALRMNCSPDNAKVDLGSFKTTVVYVVASRLFSVVF